MRRGRRTAAALLALALAGLAPGGALAAGSTTQTHGQSAPARTPTATPAPTPVVPGSNGPVSSGNPFGGVNPISPAPPATSTTPAITAASSTSASGSLSSGTLIVIIAGALIVLGGISFYIWRDARRRAPVPAGRRGTGGSGAGTAGRGADGGAGERRPGSKAPVKARKLSPAERRRRKRGRARR